MTEAAARMIRIPAALDALLDDEVAYRGRHGEPPAKSVIMREAMQRGIKAMRAERGDTTPKIPSKPTPSRAEIKDLTYMRDEQ